MKKLVSITAIAILLISSFTTDIDAQYGRNKRSGCWNNGNGNYNNGYCQNMNNSRMPYYDLNNEVKFNGTMESFEVFRGKGMRGGLEITLNDGKDKQVVHVGPTWYLEDISLDINKGDKLEIFGSKVELNGKTVILASKVTFNGKTYSLRDKYGFPKWSGRNRKF